MTVLSSYFYNFISDISLYYHTGNAEIIAAYKCWIETYKIE